MNGVLLQHLLYILSRISSHSEENMMTTSNLAICVGPSVLWANDPAVSLEPNNAKDVSSVMQVLVDEYASIYGPDSVPSVFAGGDEGSGVCANNEGSSSSSPAPPSSVQQRRKSEEQGMFVKGPNAGKSTAGMLAGGVHRNSRSKFILTSTTRI